MYVCMYVCIQLEVLMQRPTHIVVARVPWPSRRFSEPTAGEGTALTHACPSPAWSAEGGTCMYRYKYIVCVLSVHSIDAKAGRPPGLRCLSDRWSVPVIVSGVACLLLLLLPAAGAAAAFRRAAFALTGAMSLLFSCQSPVRQVDQS